MVEGFTRKTPNRDIYKMIVHKFVILIVLNIRYPFYGEIHYYFFLLYNRVFFIIKKKMVKFNCAIK